MDDLIIFDLDQTLVRPVEGVKVPNNLREQIIIPGVIERCAQLRADGVKLAIASNQGGVALNICTLEDAINRVASVADQIGAEKWMICIYHEKAVKDLNYFHMPYRGVTAHPFYRKPNPGMLALLMYQMRAFASNTLFVGDQLTDAEAATNAGIRFQWAEGFFGWT